MSDPIVPLRIDAQHLDGRLVIVIRGDLDSASAPALGQVASAIVTNTGRLTLDMSGVTFMDSSGLSVLAVAARHCSEAHSKVVVLDPSPCVARLLDLSRMDQVLQLEQSKSFSSR